MTALVAPILCLVTDRRRTCPDARTPHDEVAGLEAWLDAAIAAGLSIIQLREPDLEAASLERLARAVTARATGTPTRVVVNDRLDVVIAAGASGLHLRGDGPPAGRVRPMLPAGALVGRSIHRPDEARVHAGSTDYLLFGSVFASASKPDDHVPAGLEALGEAVRAAASRAPVMAIGGVTVATARACVEAGADGLAGIGLFLPAAVDGGRDGLPALVENLRGAWRDADDAGGVV